MNYKTEQESFWSQDFGNEYIKRNTLERLVESNIDFFKKVLGITGIISSVMEFGANIGANLKAIKTLVPGAQLNGVEINKNAWTELKKVVGEQNAHHGSVLDFESEFRYELVITKGFLIHVSPEELPSVYQKIFDSTKKFILIAEYFNPTPVALDYRGFKNKLFKRDFCGEMMDLFPQLKIVDYGFLYKRDPKYPHDNLNWFLLEKASI